MSVYTQLTLPQIQHFADQYALQVLHMQAIQAGIENSNYFVDVLPTAQVEQPLDRQALVLTLFEVFSQADASLLMPLLSHLHGNGIPVAVPLRALHGEHVGLLADKPAQFAPRLRGSHPTTPTLAQVHAMGVMLARLHQVLDNASLLLILKPLLDRHATSTPQHWLTHAMSNLDPFSAADRVLLQQLVAQMQTVQRDYPALPSGLVHGDLFRDNCLFEGDVASGVLDFSEISQQPLLIDIAITLNDFCSDWAHEDHTQAQRLHPEKLSLFLQGYQSIRLLSTDEMNALPSYLALCACRFWLSRLVAAQRHSALHQDNADVLLKDPEEMRRMLVARLANC